MGIKFLIENDKGEIMDLYSYIKHLEKRISYLEGENVGTTNTLYEIENKIDTGTNPSYNEDPPRMCGEMIFMDDDEDV